ncbi:PilC/PilY family type IV pilus protein [Ferrimonas aestuarii]|uniref:Type IV pilin biogenesis protein n=1 Tax=Ferrimonas aestuarii TaxID=2569539 RepID=A0A4U1BG83_9GAMM|nr:PilC/PilY family type IV pilus protein [Ferrimonas aestuarii]TKB50198.1 type IV pilin biogenesis protein [Ferrimonas aestuarii]
MRSLFWLLTLFVALVCADDTELYVWNSEARVSRPQVLIVFDNSGSMRTEELQSPPPYDWSVDYSQGRSFGRLYYVRGQINDNLPNPGDPEEFRHFSTSLNGCASSLVPVTGVPGSPTLLEHNGFYTDAMMSFRQGARGDRTWQWRSFPSSLKRAHGDGTVDSYGFDCLQDISDAAIGNAIGHPRVELAATGFPQNGELPYDGSNTSDSDLTITQNASASLNATGFDHADSVTLFSENYLYYRQQAHAQMRSRLSIAKEVITSMVQSTPGVDFGLAVFNLNDGNDQSVDGSHGGRILSAVQHLSAGDKAAFIDAVAELTASTWTPLCETVFEGYRYFSGAEILTGQALPLLGEPLSKDGRYLSPLSECQTQAYIVLITDGSPTKDEALNSLIRNELGVTSSESYSVEDPYRTLSSGLLADNYLPALADAMHRGDLSDSVKGHQRLVTYTIGFSQDGIDSAGALLAETARRGGGRYYPAADASALSNALQQVFSQILQVDASFTSPSIAANSFDRTQTLDSVYYSMFLPSERPRWLGNLKKLKITSQGMIVDSRAQLAINEQGDIADHACTYWTSSATCLLASSGGDGNAVDEGGVQEAITNQLNRKVLTEPEGESGLLQPFSVSQLKARAGGESLLEELVGLSGSELQEAMEWWYGKDVDDDDRDGVTNEWRQDLFGDPLHSKPLAIHYGGSKGVRILVGTNAGMLHMFEDRGQTLLESWAYLPTVFAKNVMTLKLNTQTGGHSVYGIDGSPVAFIDDANGDGEIVASDGDRVWLYFGLRRGGRSYYALDISEPDAPRLMWLNSAESVPWQNLGQSWPEPVVTRVPDYPLDNLTVADAKPVLILGGGYDVAKDADSVGAADSLGRGVYLVDAQTGALIHRFIPQTSQTSISHMPIADSVAARVEVLDSNGDGLTDRIYASDTGGNVWRMDLPGLRKQNPWTGFKLAQLGGETDASDRRFYHEVSVAQTITKQLTQTGLEGSESSQSSVVTTDRPYDAVAIGSGHRAHPNERSVQNYLFVIRDFGIVSASYDDQPLPGHASIPEPIQLTQLLDVTLDPLGHPPDDAAELSSRLQLGQSKGWRYRLQPSEKALSAATIIKGAAFFTTFTPGQIESADSCLVAGQGRLYVLRLDDGANRSDNSYVSLGARLPDTPQIVVPPTNLSSDTSWNPKVYLVGVGQGFQLVDDKVVEMQSGSGDPDKELVPRFIYQYQEEQH